MSWNTHLESMLCYSHTSGGISVRVGSLPPRSPQTMLGVVVGLCGATAFCLRGNVMNNVSLSLGSTMWQFIEAGLFEYVPHFHIHPAKTIINKIVEKCPLEIEQQ